MATKTTENITLLPYRERVKLVQMRLQSLRHPKVTRLPKSARVVAAEKVVADWQARDDEHEKTQRDTHRAKLNEVQDALIVGDMLKAVSLLQKLKA